MFALRQIEVQPKGLGNVRDICVAADGRYDGASLACSSGPDMDIALERATA